MNAINDSLKKRSILETCSEDGWGVNPPVRPGVHLDRSQNNQDKPDGNIQSRASLNSSMLNCSDIASDSY